MRCLPPPSAPPRQPDVVEAATPHLLKAPATPEPPAPPAASPATPPPEPEAPSRARRPSTRPGAAFNPEVPPDDEGEGAFESAGASRD